MRVGAVRYLNSKPLIHGLAGADGVDLLLDLPSRLADRLARRELDGALIPTIELLADPELMLVSDACVASRGPVRSVKTLFRRPPREVQKVALDEGSRTSAALLRVLLYNRFGIRPECISLPIGSGPESVRADAVLLIGDRAMGADPGQYAEVWDMGAEWRAWTGLPFVFACWAAWSGATREALAGVLGRARDAGVASLAQIAEAEAPPLGLLVGDALEYLTHSLHFRIEEEELAAMGRFAAYAAELGLIPHDPNLPRRLRTDYGRPTANR
ncbi:Chorismate dehydratase [Pirellulimonas nuda]|uniref:Chorismate dehydratase n=1 Tax=Pirellulimonas nuda TaxID=2528009 RepID=A0A518DB73_9BACT|nr:menaquinone biosynthesis protein [Pirellulimonas nuda]QDU88702.1 Chorismate dehydratase [Pirellulimonas nuda]